MAFPIVPVLLLPFFTFLVWVWGNVRNEAGKKHLKARQVPFGYKGIPGIGFLPHFKGPECQRKLIEMKERYGKICQIRMGSFDCVFLNDYELIKCAWNNEKLCSRPTMPGISQRTKGFKGGIIFNDGKDFVDQRRFVLYLLKRFGLGKTETEVFVNKEITNVIEVIEEKEGRPMSTRHLFNIASFNILWSIITGGSRFSFHDAKLKDLVRVLNRHMELNDGARAAFFMPWLSTYFPWFIGWKSYLDDANKIFDFWMSFAQEIISSYQAHMCAGSTNQQDGFLTAYCEKISACTDSTSSFYGERGLFSLATILQDLFIAGSETTASTLQWAFLYLAAFPECQEKIASEIFTNIGPMKKPTANDFKRLPYTEAFINETLRFSTLAPLGMLHSTSEEVVLHGYLVPKDTIVIANVCAAHYDARYWRKPDMFRPERFLSSTKCNKDDDDEPARNIESFIPFSIGKRYCPGSKLAMQTLFLTVVQIIQRFEIRASDCSSIQLEPKIGISAIPQPHKLVFSKRNMNY